MNFLNVLVYTFCVLANFILGLVVFFRNPKSIINRFFTLFTLPIIGWLVTLFILANSTSHELVNLSTKLNSAFLILLGYALFYFSYYFPQKTYELTPLLHFSFALETFGLIALALFTLEITRAGFISGESLTLYGRLYPLFVIHFLVFSGACLLTLLSKREKFKGFPRAQIECLLLGLSGALLFGMIMHILSPWLFQIYDFYLLRPLSTLLFLGFTSYGIVKFRLLDVRLIVARSVGYFLTIFLIGLITASGLYAFSVLVIGESIQRSQIFISVLLVIFILFASPTLSRFFEKITDRVFFKGRYNTAELLRKLSLITTSTLSLEDLIIKVVEELFEKMKILQGSVVLLKDHNKILGVKMGQVKSLLDSKKEGVHWLLKEIKDEDRILVLDELHEGKVKEIFRKLGLTIVVPLRVRGDKVGFLLLAEKSSGDIYSAQDIAVFEILGPELAIAIQNALAYEEIRRFNITLKKEIQGATQELRKANERLKELDKLKDEFLSIASHELRTPMTAVKGYIDMILSGDAGKINKKTREFLTEAFEVTDRLANLVNDMLDVSRVEQKRLSLEIEKIDLSSEVKKVLEHLSSLAKEKKLVLFYRPFKNLPRILADSSKVRQVLNNLIGNAIAFTGQGEITVSHKLDNGFVITSVKDTGIGISKSGIRMLFQKFGKVNGGPKREKGGTGLGLYISKGLVESMNGKIWVKSRLGKGSTFSFSLPKGK